MIVLLLILVSVGLMSPLRATDAGKQMFFGTLEACQTAEVGSFSYYEPRDLTRLGGWDAKVARGEATLGTLKSDHCFREETVVGRRIVRLRAGNPVFLVGGVPVADGRCGNALGEGAPVVPPPPSVEVAVVVVCGINCTPAPTPPPCDPCAPTPAPAPLPEVEL